MSNMTHTLNVRLLVLIGMVITGFVPAFAASAATAQIAATPTNITAGQSATLSWNCYQSVSASINQGIGNVANSGSMQVTPSVTKTYTVVCTDSTSSASASVTITVDNNGCYTNTEAGVYGEQVFPRYSESSGTVIFDEDGGNALNGGGLYDSQNHYQQCINACAAYGTCNYKFTLDYTSNENSQTRFLCMAVNPVTGPRQAKATETTTATPTGGVTKETTYWAIQYTTVTGGNCTPPPPAPTATLTANPVSISSGQSSTLTWSSTNATQCIGTGFSTGNATSGTRSVSPTATNDYYVTCTNVAGSAAASARVTVGTAPNLSAGDIAPTTATAATATSFSATVSNTGTASTAISFPVLFQRATTNQGANALDLGSTTTTALAVNGSRSVSFTATLPTAGTWYMRACADKRTGGDVNGLVSETDESNNCGAWTPITVAASAATYPNLIASTPTPITAVAGTAKTFSSTITNNGATTTGKTTQNVFQIDLNEDHTVVSSTVAGSASPTLAANATNVTTASYTFAAAGSFFVRTCADNNTSLAGTVVESNEGDNCSSWRPVTVSGSGSTEMTCSVTPTSITTGQSVTWSVTPNNLGVGAYTWTPSETGTALTGSGNKNATLVRSYASAGFYGMDVAGTGGYSDSCPTVTVGNPCGSASATVTATPNRVSVGSTATLTFSASGINGSCTLTGPGVSQTITANSCAVADTEVVTPAITGQSVYTLSCTGATAATAIVNVIPRFQEF